jgi:hypothetical protein
MSKMETKKIIVNLDIGKSKTTNKTHKNRPYLVPSISPNHLKNELMNKIKQHKNKKDTKLAGTTGVIVDDYTDEFCKSIDYLNSVKKKTSEMPQSTKMSIATNAPRLVASTTHTLKNNLHKYIQMDLPEELMENSHPYSSPDSFNNVDIIHNPIIEKLIPTIKQSLLPLTTSTYNVDKEVPYGCLKNGMKPGYRDWKNTQTRKNIPSVLNDNPSFSENSLNQTERRMEPPPHPIVIALPAESVQLIIDEKEHFIEPLKTFIKKTTVKTHTLGKSTKYRKVGVLIKNRNTRKNILIAQKELKKTPLHEIKKQLKKQGLIKVGTTAPVDVLRQTYESSILAGEITNQNKDTLFHNFLNDPDNDGSH